MPDLTEQVLLPKTHETLIGSSIQRIDILSKIQGHAIFARDMELPRMLHVSIKRSESSRAEILGIDYGAASHMPGVKAIITGKDFPFLESIDTPPLARKFVTYHRQAVAAVAADTITHAFDAKESIRVSYQTLEPLLDSKKSALLLKSKNIQEIEEIPRIHMSGRHLSFSRGDIEDGFKKSFITLEQEYKTSAETHFQMEPITFLARPDSDGGVTVWGTSPGPTKLQYEVAKYLGMPKDKVRAIIPYIGGWFGSKEENHYAAISALLAIRSNRPVKLELSREETIVASGVRHPSVIVVKDGVSRDGYLQSREIYATYDGGAFGMLGNVMLKNSLMTAGCVYYVPNFFFDAIRAYTNRVPGSAKRAPMGVQMAFAIESQMDRIAAELGIDPLEFRKKNLLRDGGEDLFGEKVSGGYVESALDAVAKEVSFWSRDLPTTFRGSHWKHGIGYAVSAKWTFAAPCQAIVRLHSDLTVDVMAPVVENGQGIYTGISQIVAESLGLPIGNIRFRANELGSESSWGLGPGARSSQQLVNMGNAVLRACNEVKLKVARISAAKLGTSMDDIRFSLGRAFSESNPNRSIYFQDLFLDRTMFGTSVKAPPISVGEFVGFGTEAKNVGEFDEQGHLKGGKASPYYVSAAQAIEVLVNEETGQVSVTRVVGSIDAGRAINRSLVQAQVEGSIMMGLSSSLGEELVFDLGVVMNPNLADYKILTSVESPDIKTIILESPYLGGPFGAKGVGEAAIMPTASALRNAIKNATGVWLNSLPMTREKLLFAIHDRNN